MKLISETLTSKTKIVCPKQSYIRKYSEVVIGKHANRKLNNQTRNGELKFERRFHYKMQSIGFDSWTPFVVCPNVYYSPQLSKWTLFHYHCSTNNEVKTGDGYEMYKSTAITRHFDKYKQFESLAKTPLRRNVSSSVISPTVTADWGLDFPHSLGCFIYLQM